MQRRSSGMTDGSEFAGASEPRRGGSPDSFSSALLWKGRDGERRLSVSNPIFLPEPQPPPLPHKPPGLSPIPPPPPLTAHFAFDAGDETGGPGGEPAPRPLRTMDRFGSKRMREILDSLAIEDTETFEGPSDALRHMGIRDKLEDFDPAPLDEQDDRKGKAVASYNYVQRVLPKNALLTPQNLRPAVRDEIVNQRRYTKGFAHWKRMEPLNRYLGGLRPGELTVLTGPTGIGKTTFLCDYAVDLWAQGVRTMFASFELAPVRIFKTMLHQFSGRPLWRFENHPEVDKWVDRFIRTNVMLFLRNEHFEGRSADFILQAIRHQTSAGGIQHIIIDNLQFMIAASAIGSGPSRESVGAGGGGASKLGGVEWQMAADALATQFRRLATETGAHITLVVHPKKESPGAALEINALSGRLVQDSDTVLILQRTAKSGWRRNLFIVKNRYGGDKVEDERLEVRFNKDNYCHQIVDRSRAGPALLKD